MRRDITTLAYILPLSWRGCVVRLAPMRLQVSRPKAGESLACWKSSHGEPPLIFQLEDKKWKMSEWDQKVANYLTYTHEANIHRVSVQDIKYELVDMSIEAELIAMELSRIKKEADASVASIQVLQDRTHAFKKRKEKVVEQCVTADKVEKAALESFIILCYRLKRKRHLP